MGLTDDGYKKIFSESEDIKGVFEINSAGEVSNYKLLDEKSFKSKELLQFLKNVLKFIRQVSDVKGERIIEILISSDEMMFLVTPLMAEGTFIVFMLPREGNIGLARMIAGKLLNGSIKYK